MARRELCLGSKRQSVNCVMLSVTPHPQEVDNACAEHKPSGEIEICVRYVYGCLCELALLPDLLRHWQLCQSYHRWISCSYASGGDFLEHYQGQRRGRRCIKVQSLRFTHVQRNHTVHQHAINNHVNLMGSAFCLVSLNALLRALLTVQRTASIKLFPTAWCRWDH